MHWMKENPAQKKTVPEFSTDACRGTKGSWFHVWNITEKENKSSRSHWEKQNNWERRVGHSPWVLFGHWRILKHESLEVIFKYSMDYLLSRLIILRIHEFMDSSEGFANTPISTMMQSSNKWNCQHHHCTTPLPAPKTNSSNDSHHIVTSLIAVQKGGDGYW